MPKKRTYSELRRLNTFEDRFRYLRLAGEVGYSTFGFDRWLNQNFYRSRMWKQVRAAVIVRDNGRDLGIEGYEIHTDLIVHHMNPMSADDIKHGELWILDPNYLITTSLKTHNAIHFGDESQLPRGPITRLPGDTKLW
jgi:hypothetical protein